MKKLRECENDTLLVALLLAGILMVMGAYRIFSYLCENARMDAVTFLLGGACALLAVGGFLLARASFRRLKELHLGQKAFLAAAVLSDPLSSDR